MYCYSCGAQIPEGSKFCPECGTRLTPTTNTTRDVHEGAEPEANKYEPARNEESIPKRSTVQDNVKKKPKRHRLLKILIVILCIFAAFLLYDSRELYIYSTMTVISNEQVTKQDRQILEPLFRDTYLLHTDDDYLVLNVVSGLGFSESEIKQITDDTYKLEISTGGNYAYVDIKDHNSNNLVTISYIKPTLTERIYFISKYYTL